MGILSELRTALRNKSIVKNIFFALLIIIFMHLIYGVYRSSQTLQEGKKGRKGRKGKGGKKINIPKNCIGKDRRFSKRCAKLICSQRKSAKSRKKCNKRSRCKRKKGRGYAFLANRCRRCIRTKKGKPARWTKITINGKKKIACRRIKLNKVEVRGFAGAQKTAAAGVKEENKKSNSKIDTKQVAIPSSETSKVVEQVKTEVAVQEKANNDDSGDQSAEQDAEETIEKVVEQADKTLDQSEDSNTVKVAVDQAEKNADAQTTPIQDTLKPVFSSVVKTVISNIYKNVTTAREYNVPNFDINRWRAVYIAYLNVITALMVQFIAYKQHLFISQSLRNSDAKYLFYFLAIVNNPANRHPTFDKEPMFVVLPTNTNDKSGSPQFNVYIHKGRESKDYLKVMGNWTGGMMKLALEPLIKKYNVQE